MPHALSSMPAARPVHLPVRLRWALGGVLVLAFAVVAGFAYLTRPAPGRFLAQQSPLVVAEAAPERAEAEGFISQAVRARAESGLAVDFRVLRPAVAPGERLPVVVLLGGHRTGRDAVDLLGTPGPVVVAALDYPYQGPERPRGLVQSLATIPAARTGLRDTPAAVLLAIDWLLGQPWADPEQLELVGVSLGVPFAMVAGALDDRVRRVWLIHGGGDHRRWIKHNLRSRIESDLLRDLTAGLVHRLAHGPSLDEAHWMPRIAPRPVVIVGAREDQRLPGELVEGLFAAAHPPKELHWLEGGHVDRRPEAVRPLLELVRAGILRD